MFGGCIVLAKRRAIYERQSVGSPVEQRSIAVSTAPITLRVDITPSSAVLHRIYFRNGQATGKNSCLIRFFLYRRVKLLHLKIACVTMIFTFQRTYLCPLLTVK